MSAKKPYYLLPFRFHRLSNGNEILVNEVGDFLICPRQTAQAIVQGVVKTNPALYADLMSRFFISDRPVPELIDVLATRYRTKKSFLDQGPVLHIFVITLRCNQRCKYCQASSRCPDSADGDMSFSDIDRAVSLTLQSPSQVLTIEFQGGEPLLAFDRLQYTVEQFTLMNRHIGKSLRYVLCTNLLDLSEQTVEWCKRNKVLISTSLDGPEHLHLANRPTSRPDAFATLERNIAWCREAIGSDSVSALLTVTKQSLDCPREIIDEYRKQGFSSVFLRPINPYGYARTNSRTVGYDVAAFLHFYSTALEYIIDLNRHGTHFVELFAQILLTKMLTPFATSFTDLQSPCGPINNVLVYNYDGRVYSSDEGRMLAEHGDSSFCLGRLGSISMRNLSTATVFAEVMHDGVNESLPGCSECAFLSYCGADPVRNYATQGNMAGYRPTSEFCRRNKAICELLFTLMSQNTGVDGIFESWIGSS